MKRYHVIREVFLRDRWNEIPLERANCVFRFRRDAEILATYLHAIRTSNDVRFRVVRRPVP